MTQRSSSAQPNTNFQPWKSFSVAWGRSRSRSKIITFLVFAIVLGLAPAQIEAGIVSVEPDVFGDGVDISNAFPNVALSVVGGGGGPVFSRADGAASTGSRTFGNSAANGAIAERIWFEGPGFSPNPAGPGPVLRVDFSVATDFVAIDIVNQDSFDGGIMRAFNANDVEIFSQTSPVTGQFGIAPAPQTLSVSLGAFDIAYVTIAGQSAQDSVHLDNLRFNDVNAVPEPSTIALIMLGIATVSLRRFQPPTAVS